MILDFRYPAAAAELGCDVCIVGAGAAGIIIARELASLRLRIIVVESGGLAVEDDTQALCACECLGLRHEGVVTGRFRALGGSTVRWAGQSRRLDPIDFEIREWVPNSGWPLGYDTLEPYYCRAEVAMHVPTYTSDDRVWADLGVEPPSFRPDRLRFEYTRFSRKPNFAKAYGALLRRSSNIVVLLHANVAELCANSDGRWLHSATVRSLTGKTGTIRAQAFVLCCGGIENARILLASRKAHPNGLGNHNDLVGRYFQDHPHAITASIRTPDARRLQNTFGYFFKRGRRHFTKSALAPEMQRRRRTLNCVAHLVYGHPADAGVEAAKRLFQAVLTRRFNPAIVHDLRHAFGDPSAICEEAWRYVSAGRLPASTANWIGLDLHLEQAPNPNSRITLGSDLDALGMPKARIDWRVTDLERHTLGVMTSTISAEFARLGLGHVMSDGCLEAPGAGWQDRLADFFHHIGTTRMADTPRRGVVDPNCRVYGVENLFVAGSSVFPTSGFSNPTLTILALCLRLADHLRNLVTRPESTPSLTITEPAVTRTSL